MSQSDIACMRRTAAFLFFWLVFSGGILALFGVTYWYWQLRQNVPTLSLETKALNGPREPLVLQFSQPVRPSSFEQRVALKPALPFHVVWQDEGRTLLIQPETPWPLAETFEVWVGAGKTFWYGRTPEWHETFESPAYPVLASLTPTNAARDVLLGIEDPLRATFDRSVRDFFIDFRLDPVVPVVYENNPEKTEFALLPTTVLSPGTEHRLSVWAKWRGAPDTDYHLLGQTVFTTLPPTPKAWNANLALRIDEAKRFTRAKRLLGKYIDINLANQVMTLFENGRAIDAYLISSGKRGMETPRGDFAVHNKARRPWSKQYSLYMPYWQAITSDGKVGIHELPEWPGGYKEGANHLGTPVSHGCVRLGVGAAERVYAWSEVGTPIVIY